MSAWRLICIVLGAPWLRLFLVSLENAPRENALRRDAFPSLPGDRDAAERHHSARKTTGQGFDPALRIPGRPPSGGRPRN